MVSNQNTVDHTIHSTFSYGAIYIYSIPGEHHNGRLKIGSTTVNSTSPTQVEIERAAHERIRQQTTTADVRYNLEYATLAVTNNGDYLSDYMVHSVLKRSGYERKSENVKNSHSEWFTVDLNTAKNAIQAAKEGRAALNSNEMLRDVPQLFDYRPNQEDAIAKTSAIIKRGRKHYLWNAKMRFGKTSAAMEVARRNDMKKVLILTHRPSVQGDWESDFRKVFHGTNNQFASSTRGATIASYLSDDTPFVYFASIQDVRLSKRVVSDEASGSRAKGFDKNDEIFDTTWDMLIIDEAHEGTQRDLGKTTLEKINANFTLQLSGTPFNIIHKLEEDAIYTWDYVMEQREKLKWDEKHPGEPNPYAELPALSMFTYDVDTFGAQLGDIGQFEDATSGAFRFHEFFRVHKDDNGNDTPEFIHETMVKRFIDLLADDQQQTKFPYSTTEYRSHIKHSLWLLPNRTKVIEAMEKLLKNHPIFGKFGVVNISGNTPNDDDEGDNDAKSKVTSAIKNHEYTITLTGQRLTTGASVPEWTAVIMLSDTSSATTYLQTAFRCQTPAKIDGKLKTQGYVFDFAPDRTLKLVAEAIELNHKSGKTNTPEQRQAMQDFLNFCPIIASNAGGMRQFDVGGMLEQLKRAIIERVSANGFDDPKLYIMDELMKLDELAAEEFNNLRNIVGTSTNQRTNEVKVNDHGMTDLKRKQAEEAERKKKTKKELTEEEKERLKQLKEAREQSKTAITILRAVSIRMPMLVYGANVSYRQDISLEQFIDLVDDESWTEFMPAGLSKDKFRSFTKYYDEEVFRGVARNIRAKALDCDDLLPTERIQALADVFATFKNPDKETVLTPWNVVNMHVSTTLGGYDFRDGVIGGTGKPEWKGRGEASRIWSQPDATILEINSKSGLYPLLAAYNMYEQKLKTQRQPEDKVSKRLWREVLQNNIYVLCKSPMAAAITRRTLAGYDEHAKLNVIYIEDLVNKLRHNDEYKGYNIHKELQDKFARSEGKEVKFTAVVGNPPYQGENHQQIYPYFYLAAREVGDYVSLIFPTGWQDPKDANNLRQLNNKEIKEDRQIISIDNRQNVFPGIAGAEWTNIILWKRGHDNGQGGDQMILKNGKEARLRRLVWDKDDIEKPKEINELKDLVTSHADFKPVQNITSPRKPYGLDTDFLKDPSRYGLPMVQDFRAEDTDIELWTGGRGGRVIKYVPSNYPFPKRAKALEKYKVLVAYAWGNWSEGAGLGGAYSDIIIAGPDVATTETWQESGIFDDFDTAQKHAKYLMTKFARALLYFNKHSQHSTTAWGAVPVQDYHEPWWDKSIDDIDKCLMDKYAIPQNLREFVSENIQQKSESNIVNFKR